MMEEASTKHERDSVEMSKRKERLGVMTAGRLSGWPNYVGEEGAMDDDARDKQMGSGVPRSRNERVTAGLAER